MIKERECIKDRDHQTLSGKQVSNIYKSKVGEDVQVPDERIFKQVVRRRYPNLRAKEKWGYSVILICET